LQKKERYGFSDLLKNASPNFDTNIMGYLVSCEDITRARKILRALVFLFPLNLFARHDHWFFWTCPIRTQLSSWIEH